jgi:hypothetical protein
VRTRQAGGPTFEEANLADLANAIPIKLSNGSIGFVEVSDAGDGRQKVSEGTEARLSQAMDVIKAMSSEITDVMKSLKPQRLAVELGFELAVESGKLTALLVKGSGKANIKVTLEWKAAEG